MRHVKALPGELSIVVKLHETVMKLYKNWPEKRPAWEECSSYIGELPQWYRIHWSISNKICVFTRAMMYFLIFFRVALLAPVLQCHWSNASIRNSSYQSRGVCCDDDRLEMQYLSYIIPVVAEEGRDPLKFIIFISSTSLDAREGTEYDNVQKTRNVVKLKGKTKKPSKECK